MKFADLKRHLRNDTLCAAYCIQGDDSFVLDWAVERFCSLVTMLPELNIHSMQSPTASSLIAACQALPIACERRIVICTGGVFRGQNGQLVCSYLAQPNDQTILLFRGGVDIERTCDFHLELVDCNRLDTGLLRTYIVHRVTELGSQIDDSAVKLLIEFCDGYLTRIHTEIAKLCAFAGDRMIVPDDVQLLVYADVGYKIFDLGEALGTADARRALATYALMRDGGEKPSTLLSLLYGHFRRMFLCTLTPDDPKLHEYLSVKPFAVTISLRQAKLFGAQNLKRICDLICAADASFRQGQSDDQLALEQVILGIIDIQRGGQPTIC